MKPTKAQQDAIDVLKVSRKPVCWLGSVRAGKTTGGVMATLQAAVERQGLFLIAGYTYGSIERNILPVVMRWLDDESYEKGDYVLKKSYPYKLELSTGSIIYFVGASDEAAYKAIQGLTLTGAFVDECLLVPQSFIMQLVARLSEPEPFFLLTANKEAPDHWIKRQWIDAGLVHVIEHTFNDNPHITDGTKEWYDKLITGAYADRMLANEWGTHGNAICPKLFVGNIAEHAYRGVPVNIWYVDHYSYNTYCTIRPAIVDGDYVCEVDCTYPDSRPLANLPNHYITNDKLCYGYGWVDSNAKQLGDALSKYCLAIEDHHFRCELKDLYWKDTDKPSDMSARVRAVALGLHFIGRSSKPFEANVI